MGEDATSIAVAELLRLRSITLSVFDCEVTEKTLGSATAIDPAVDCLASLDPATQKASISVIRGSGIGRTKLCGDR